MDQGPRRNGAHGGRAHVRGVRDAALGGRSRFERCERPARSVDGSRHGTRMNSRILVVDDSALSRRRLRQILEAAGYEVAEADDGLSALERYFIDKPDVVLLDLVMKGMYGLEVLAKLRELD